MTPKDPTNRVLEHILSEESIEEMANALDEKLTSRRGFMSQAAKIGGGAALLAGSSAGLSVADDETSNTTTTSGGGGGDGQVSTVDVLNYALTLEHLENVFYQQGLQTFSKQELAQFADRFAGQTRESTLRFFQAIQSHEQAHVDQLSQVITDLGGTPVEACTYDFGYQSAGEFAAVAQALENTGVSAYNGAINLLENDELLTAAATIATVEGRHASYLNLINGEIPFPNAFDPARSMAEVTEIAGQFIVECPGQGQATTTNQAGTGTATGTSTGTETGTSPGTTTTDGTGTTTDYTTTDG
jgi:rubrerythrin